MLQRSKTSRSSRRVAPPAGGATPDGSSTGTGMLGAESAAPPAAPTTAAAEAEARPGPDVHAAPVLPSAPEAAAPEPVPVSEIAAPESPSGLRDRCAGGPPAGEAIPAATSVAAAPTSPPSETPAQTTHGKGMSMMENTMQQANKAAETFLKAAEDAAEFGRGNVEALTRATQIYVAGVQDLGRQTFALVQGLTDQAIEGAKALSTVKSLQEAATVQSNYARAVFEKSVTESAKLSEAALKLAEQTFAPLSARFTLAAERLTRAQAAAAV